MFRRSTRLALVLAAFAATTSVATASQALPPTELLGGNGPVVPLKNAAMITKTDVGYRYEAGQQDSHLVVTQVGERLRFVDTGTAKLDKAPASCREQQAAVGIAVTCKLPARYNESNPMFVEIWPRLGDDFIDGSALSSTFRFWVLADAGIDTVFGGAGDDFVNGAQDKDTVHAGAGDDWIRTGIGNDRIWGDGGQDRLLGLDGADRIRGGEGEDEVNGGLGNDRLWGDGGGDKVACGAGADDAWFDYADRTIECEGMLRI